MKDKAEAIKKAPEQQNVSQLRSFLCMLNYYHQFLPNIATTLEPSLEVEARTAEGIRQCKRVVAIL